MFNNQPTQQLVQKPEEPEVKKGLWSIDKSEYDGQIKAGEVDKTQEEFLKTTTWIK